MNPCGFITFSLVLLLTATKTSSQSVTVGDDKGAMNKCLDNERDALLLFKAPLQDPDDNGCLSTWTTDDHDCCNWRGVTCNDQTGHVTGLYLGLCSLEGEISRSLLNLTYLDDLDLSFNSFHGTIPRFIGSLTRLIKLDLSFNSFYGTIPQEFGNLTNLQVLHLKDVGKCRIENIEWLSRLSHLEELEMYGVSLAKANHWVDTISSLQNLSWLSLWECELSQVMYPYSSSLNSSSSIKFLSLRLNNLTSSMYDWLRPLTSNKLGDLVLSGNMLGGIPKYFGNLCSLESLSLDNNSAVVQFPDFLNNLSGCTSHALKVLSSPESQFTGSLSDEIQSFTSLEVLDLRHNRLNGTISQKLWELPKLQTLDLSFNTLRVPSNYHSIQSVSQVEHIDMRYCKIGPGFPKWIQALKNLTHLDLSNTGISDTTPLEFWDTWPSQLLYLNLSFNNISGKLPDLLSNFANITSKIDLSSNNFHGPIPNVSSTLSSLNLSRNRFSGGISFVCQMVDGFLSFLDLSRNSFIGQLPDCLWHFNRLGVINLGHNNLFGKLPPSIGSLTLLQVLSLYNNSFSGDLPLSLKNCTNLISLNLGANNFSGNVPVWIGENLSMLYIFSLRSNNFFGTIPLELCHLNNLQILDLSMNKLHGTMPSCLSNLTSMVQQGISQDVQYTGFGKGKYFSQETYVDNAMLGWQGDEREFVSNLKLLKIIDLSSNNLTGQVPYEITNLHDLIVLNMSKNTFFGEIPPKIGEMKRLLTLDLSRNNFSGGIPSSMSHMTLLNDLDLSYNNLSGRIPSSTQLQSFEASRYDGNAQLCGPPLTKNCPGDKESKVPPLIGKNEGDGEDIDGLWGWFYFGGGTGFATGFLAACGALLVNRRGKNAFFYFYDRFIANLKRTRQV